jgi:carbon-monoxide dehydrogenase large subunit
MAWAPDGVEVNNPEHWPLARGTVKHVGDPVAVVLSQDRYAAVDAAEEVLVEYEPLPVVTDIETALDEGAPLVHEQFGTNRTHDWSLGGGDLEAGFAEADVIVERRVVNHRISGAPIEPRGVLADYRAGSITVHSSTQVPHFVRLFMGLMLGISEQQVRIIAPRSAAASAPSSRSRARRSSAPGRRGGRAARSSGSRRARSTWRSATTAATRWPRSAWGPSATGP